MTRASEARHRFQQEFDSGVRNRKLLAVRCNVSPSTVSRYMRMAMNGEDMTPHYVKPTARKFTTPVRRSLAQFLTRNPLQSTEKAAKYLSGRFGKPFSGRGVQTVLHKMGYEFSPNKRTHLKDECKRERILWCNEHKGMDWKRIWALDEAYFHVKRRREEYPRKRHQQQPQHQETLGVGIVAAISNEGKSSVSFLKQDWTPKDLIPILQQELLPSVTHDPTVHECDAFLMDNDGRHRNKEVSSTLEDYGIEKMSFLPSNSPDLNPMEIIIRSLKKSVRAKAPSNEQELREAILEAWDEISPETLHNLFESMPGRVQHVIDQDGNRVPV